MGSIVVGIGSEWDVCLVGAGGMGADGGAVVWEPPAVLDVIHNAHGCAEFGPLSHCFVGIQALVQDGLDNSVHPTRRRCVQFAVAW